MQIKSQRRYDGKDQEDQGDQGDQEDQEEPKDKNENQRYVRTLLVAERLIPRCDDPSQSVGGCPSTYLIEM